MRWHRRLTINPGMSLAGKPEESTPRTFCAHRAPELHDGSAEFRSGAFLATKPNAPIRRSAFRFVGREHLQIFDVSWGHEPWSEVAQASSPASSPGVPPGVRAGSGTLPQLAAGTDCATRFMGSFDLQPWTRPGARNRSALASGCCRSGTGGSPVRIATHGRDARATTPFRPWPGQGSPWSISRLVMILLSAALAAGCGKHGDAGQNKAATPDQEAASAASPPTSVGRTPTSAAPPPIVVPDNADVNATLGRLSLELRKYVVRTRTVPKSFEEFLAKSQAQVPLPPVGKKYAIENQAVVLVNRVGAGTK